MELPLLGSIYYSKHFAMRHEQCARQWHRDAGKLPSECNLDV